MLVKTIAFAINIAKPWRALSESVEGFFVSGGFLPWCICMYVSCLERSQKAFLAWGGGGFPRFR